MKKFLLFFFLLFIARSAVAVYFIKSTQTEKKNNTVRVDVEQNENKKDVSPSSVENNEENTATSSTVPRDMSNQIRVSTISGNAGVVSPIVIEGQAQEDWYFEEKFLVQVTDEQGNILGRSNAQAKGDVDAEKFIPFIVAIDFSRSSTVTGYVVLQKMTMSGVPDGGVSLKVSVNFSEQVPEKISGGCKVTGCSAQICSDKEISTTCMYREEYICYQKATCERQVDGNCGWAQTTELEACLDQFNQEE